MKQPLDPEFRLFKASMSECRQQCDSIGLKESVELMRMIIDQALSNGEISSSRSQELRSKTTNVAHKYGVK